MESQASSEGKKKKEIERVRVKACVRGGGRGVFSYTAACTSVLDMVPASHGASGVGASSAASGASLSSISYATPSKVLACATLSYLESDDTIKRKRESTSAESEGDYGIGR